MTQRCVHTSTPPSTQLWVLRSIWRCFDLRGRLGPIRSMERHGSSSCLFLLARQQMQVLRARRQ